MNLRKKPFRLALTLLALAAGLAGSAAAVQYTGVNLAGAEFGEGSLPGTYNVNYTYPNQFEVDYFKGKGMNIVRLCFRWERLQQSTNAALDSNELNRLSTFVSATTAKGVHVILDPHNYARYYGNLVGTASVPFTALSNFWWRVADIYRTNNHVIFGLMNEPNTMVTETWRDAANMSIVAIRNTGATNLILVPGNGWTGAHSWSQNWYGTPNATVMLTITDSGNNFAFDVHQYLDTDSSGTSDTVVSATIGAERLAGFTQWCKDNNRKSFLGEFAVPNSTIGAGIGDEAISNMLTHVQSNSNVWLGWTWWAAGPWWGEYMFTAEPNGSDRPVMTVLTNFVSTTVTPPSAPTANAATSVTNTSFAANWNSASGATGYRLDVATNNVFTNFITGYSNLDVGNVLTRSVTNLTANKTYYYRVRAYNAGGNSTNSSTITVTTLVNPPPAPVATAATSITNTSFTANWNPASTATGYRLDVATNNAFTNFVSGYSNLDAGNVLIRSVTNLTANKTHYYRLRAYNTGGTSTNSTTNSVTTLVNPPPASNSISGSVELQSFAGTNRLVRFVLSQINGGPTNYLQTNDVTLTFSGSVAGYNLTVPTNTTHISAKTAWHLRRRQAATFTNGAATVNFTGGANSLEGGDIVTVTGGTIADTDNAVTSSDYLLLLGYYQQAATTQNIGRADVDGDGVITSSDYLTLLGNYLASGDPR